MYRQFLGHTTTLRSPRANLVLEVQVAAGWRSWHRPWTQAPTTGPAQGEPGAGESC